MRQRWPLSATVALMLASSPLVAQDWLELTTDRFTVISDLNERDTRRWAEEFDGFVQALSGLLPLNEDLLPPLTAVLFRRDGGFSPYRIRTDSGVVGGNSGVFINYSTWSIIGMPGIRGSSADNSTIYHEAVHWYMSVDPTPIPLWFSEGIAEVFQTLEIERGEAKWGRTNPNNIDFLRRVGLQPLEEFIQIRQDEALHVNNAYYAQAWLFVHYLLIGRVNDGGPGLLARFLLNWQRMRPIEAFQATFDMTFEEMDRLLRSYLRQDRFNVASAPIPDRGEFAPIVRPAAEELVELSLARLAYGTNNDETLMRHLDRLLELAPDSAGRYDLLAAKMLDDGEDDVEALLDQAIALGSRDARTYELKARIRGNASRRSEPLFSPTAFEPSDAREIANLLVSSANLKPVNSRLYRLLVDALFSVDRISDFDRPAIENGLALYPRAGIMLLGQAALALAADNTTEAVQLMDLAINEYELTAPEMAAARSLRDSLTP